MKFMFDVSELAIQTRTWDGKSHKVSIGLGTAVSRAYHPKVVA